MNSADSIFSLPLGGLWCFSFFLSNVLGNTYVSAISFIAIWTTWLLVNLFIEVEVPFFHLGCLSTVFPATTTSLSHSSSFVWSPGVHGFFLFSFYTIFFLVGFKESRSSLLSLFTSGPWVYDFFFNVSTGFSFVGSEGSEFSSSPFSFIYSPCICNFFFGLSVGASSMESKESKSSFFAK